MSKMTTNPHDEEYLRCVRLVLEKGTVVPTRTGTPAISLTGVQMRFNVGDSFPLLSTKKISFRNIAVELRWFLGGRTNVRFLQDRKVRIWDADCAKTKERGFDYPEGELGPVYGAQWRAWDGRHDQIHQLREKLVSDPFSRRHIVSAWNVSDISKMVLPPCHMLWQVVRRPNDTLDLCLTMRSGDLGLGLPYNIASYALLLHLLCRGVGLTPGELVITINDAHIYANHVDRLHEQMAREQHPPIQLQIPERIDFDQFICRDDVDYMDWLPGYKHSGVLSMKLSV